MKKLILLLVLCLFSSTLYANRSRTITGKFVSTKTLYFETRSDDVLYILVKPKGSKEWWPVLWGARRDDGLPWCQVYWSKREVKIVFHNVHFGDTYRVSIIRSH